MTDTFAYATISTINSMIPNERVYGFIMQNFKYIGAEKETSHLKYKITDHDVDVLFEHMKDHINKHLPQYKLDEIFIRVQYHTDDGNIIREYERVHNGNIDRKTESIFTH